jgi:hypothetical protein
VEVVRPGCDGVDLFPHVRLLQYTLLLLLLTAVLFVLANAAWMLLTRAIGHVSASSKQSPSVATAAADSEFAADVGPQAQPTASQDEQSGFSWTAFRARAVQSVFVVLSLFYLRITVLVLGSFSCTRQSDGTVLSGPSHAGTSSLLLDADGQTVCYSGEHRSLAAGAAVLLLVYVAGYPMLSLALLLKGKVASSSAAAAVGAQPLRDSQVSGIESARICQCRAHATSDRH